MKIQTTKQKTMKTLKISLLIFALSFTAISAQAQKFTVESVKFELENPIPNMENCVQWINEAAEHPKTATDPKMFYYKGLVYLKVATEEAYADLKSKYPNALDISLEAFNKAIENDAKDKYTEQAKTNLLNVAIGLYNEGYNNYNDKKYAEAITAFEKAIPLLKYDVNGDLERSNLTESALVQMVAYSAVGMEDDELAMKNFQKLIDLGYYDPNVYAGLAQLKLTNGDTTGALETIAAGKEMFETDKTLINIELDIYLKQGRSQELINKLNNAILTDPENVIYYFARAISFEALDSVARAEADYNTIIEMNPEYYDAYYNKGVLHTNQVSELVDEMNEKGLYKPSEIKIYTDKINAHYEIAIEMFEYVFENNDEMGDAERLELAKSMKKIYAQLKREDDFLRMKQYVEEAEG